MRPVVAGVALVSMLALAACGEGEKSGDNANASDAPTFAPLEISDTPLSDEIEGEYQGSMHTEFGVEYAETPPLGGEHSQVPLVCGTYDDEVPAENAVHSLEHGAIWVTYDPDLVSPDGIEDLEDELPAKAILSPYEGLPTPVVVSAWNRQLRLTGPGDSGLADFIEAYEDGHTAPEPHVPCDYGIDDRGGHAI